MYLNIIPAIKITNQNSTILYYSVKVRRSYFITLQNDCIMG